MVELFSGPRLQSRFTCPAEGAFTAPIEAGASPWLARHARPDPISDFSNPVIATNCERPPFGDVLFCNDSQTKWP